MCLQFHVVVMARVLRNNSNKHYETWRLDFATRYRKGQNSIIYDNWGCSNLGSWSWSPGPPSLKETSGLSFIWNETYPRQSHCISAFFMSVLVATSKLFSACSPRRGYSRCIMVASLGARVLPELQLLDSGAQVQWLWGVGWVASGALWDLPGPGFESAAPAWQAGIFNHRLTREALRFVFYTPLFSVARKEEATSSSLRCLPPHPFPRHLLPLLPFPRVAKGFVDL